MSPMTAELADGTEIDDVTEVVEGSHGVHLKKQVDGGRIERTAYVPFDQLVYVSSDR
jgi:hypothetical protein